MSLVPRDWKLCRILMFCPKSWCVWSRRLGNWIKSQCFDVNLDVFGLAGLEIVQNPHVLTKILMFWVPHRMFENCCKSKCFDENLDVWGPAGLECIQNPNVLSKTLMCLVTQAWKLFKTLMFCKKSWCFGSRTAALDFFQNLNVLSKIMMCGVPQAWKMSKVLICW